MLFRRNPIFMQKFAPASLDETMTAADAPGLECELKFNNAAAEHFLSAEQFFFFCFALLCKKFNFPFSVSSYAFSTTIMPKKKTSHKSLLNYSKE